MKHGKKILAGLLALTLLCGAGCAAPGTAAPKDNAATPNMQVLSANTASNSFTDVADDAWYADAVSWCVENDIMSGVTSTAFSPGTDMVRVTVADALYRAKGRPEVAYGGEFSDVAANSEYAGAVAWSAANGIMSGYVKSQG